MKSLNSILLAILIAATVACGYSKKNTPPTSNMPAISQLNPTSTTHGDPTFMLTVNGSNFVSNAAVNWAGTAQTTTFVNATQLTISVPATAIANAGTVQITVTNPGTSGIYGTPAQTSSPVNFTID